MKTVSESAFSQSEIGQRDLTLLEGAKRGSLRSDHSNDNDNATNQWFDWLNEAKEACYTCRTHFGAIFWRSLSNDDVKFSYLSFRRQCESAAENLFYSPPLHEKPSCQASECTLRLFHATWPIWNNRKTLNLTQSFRCNSRRSFFPTDNWATVKQQKQIAEQRGRKLKAVQRERDCPFRSRKKNSPKFKRVHESLLSPKVFSGKVKKFFCDFSVFMEPEKTSTRMKTNKNVDVF